MEGEGGAASHGLQKKKREEKGARVGAVLVRKREQDEGFLEFSHPPS